MRTISLPALSRTSVIFVSGFGSSISLVKSSSSSRRFLLFLNTAGLRTLQVQEIETFFTQLPVWPKKIFIFIFLNFANKNYVLMMFQENFLALIISDESGSGCTRNQPTIT